MKSISLCIVLMGILAFGCGDDDEMMDANLDGGDADIAADGDANAPACEINVSTIGAGANASPSPDGIGGEGDLEVTTDVLRMVLSATDRPSGVAASGGNIVDLHLLGRGDHMNELSQLAGPTQEMQVKYTSLTEVESESPGVVIVEAKGFVSPQPTDPPQIAPAPEMNLEFVTRYEVRCGEPIVHLSSTLTNRGSVTYDAGTFGIMDVMLWGTRSLIPFCPSPGHGDACPPFNISNPLPGIVAGTYVGSMGSVSEDPGTFAFYIEDAVEEQFIGVHSSQVSSFGFFRFGEGELAVGENLTLARAVVVGDDADAASATDIALSNVAARSPLAVTTVTGSVVDPSGALSADPFRRPLLILATPSSTGGVDESSWTPITAVRVKEDGTFSAVVPVGPISWELRADGRLPQRAAAADAIEGEVLAIGELALLPMPVLSISVRDATEAPATSLPARIVVKGVGETEDPNFGPYFGGSPAANIALTDGEGDLELPLLPGTYEVYATHGPFYSIAREAVTVAQAGGSVSFELRDLNVVPDGFIKSDLHVHSGASFDSSLPLDDRVRSYIAEGVDAIVSTEHDVIFDYAPTLAQVEESLPPNWKGSLKTFVGVESTATVPNVEFPNTTGHHNVFPLTPQVGAHKNGAPDDEFLDLGTLYERMRAVPSPATPLIQINHPRSSRAGTVWLGYFDACGFDPSLPVDLTGSCFAATGPNGTRPYDFDALELLNGKTTTNAIQLFRDWYSLLRFAPGGRLPIATANSDSHELVREQPGYPVTLIRTDTPLAALDDSSFVTELSKGSVAGSYGVFVWFTAGADAVEPGRTVLSTTETSVELTITVAAAPWIPVEELRVRVGGEIVERLSVSTGELTAPSNPFGVDGVIRYSGTVTVPLSADTFITLEAGYALPDTADLDGDGVIDASDNNDDGVINDDDLSAGVVLAAPTGPITVISPDSYPSGFTNPVFVDFDGNGMYDAPMTPLP